VGQRIRFFVSFEERGSEVELPYGTAKPGDAVLRIAPSSLR